MESKAGFLGGGFKHSLLSSLFGEDSHFGYSNIFQLGWNHQPGFFVAHMQAQSVYVWILD